MIAQMALLGLRLGVCSVQIQQISIARHVNDRRPESAIFRTFEWMVMKPRNLERISIGWREWVRLPELGTFSVKAKIDTGARSSSIHAVSLKYLANNGATRVRFAIHPLQRSAKETHWAEADILEFREIRSSSGHITRRPVIVTQLQIGESQWPIELTLANRDEMGFRMLLGREALRERCLIDPGKSFYLGQPPHRIQKKKSRKKRRPS